MVGAAAQVLRCNVQYLRRNIARRAQSTEDLVTSAQIEEANTVKDRLLYILCETMGADGEFDRRREELTLLFQQQGRRRQSMDSALVALTPHIACCVRQPCS